MTTSFTQTEVGCQHISLPGKRWLPAKGFSSNYYASNTGRLLTAKHYGGYAMVAVMKPALDGSGYYRTVMDGKTVRVHRVVAQTWIKNPLKKPQVNHIDHDRTNNRIDNLEWVTKAENVEHMMKAGRQTRNHGEKCGTHILTARQVWEILSFQKRYPHMSKLAMSKLLAKTYPLSSESIRHILKGKTWKYVRHEFEKHNPPTT